MLGYSGNSVVSNGEAEWYTRRVDWISDAVGGGPETPIVSLDIVFKDTLAEATYTYWSEVPAEGVGRFARSRGSGLQISEVKNRPSLPKFPTVGLANAIDSGTNFGEPVCVSASIPFPGLFSGLQLDWIAGGGLSATAPGVTFVGYENTTVPITGETLATEHWQKADSCLDIWLIPLQILDEGRGPFGPGFDVYSQPLLFSYAAADSAPACDTANGSVVYLNMTYLAPGDADQNSQLFAAPTQCLGGTGGGSGRAASTASASVPVVWLVIGVVVALVLGLGVGLLIGVRRQWRQLSHHAQDIHAAYTKSLMDAI